MVTKTMRFLAIEMIVFPGDLIAYKRVSCWKSSERMLGLVVFISTSSWDLQPTYLLKYLVNSSNLLFMGLTWTYNLLVGVT